MTGSQKLDVILKSSLEKWSSNGGPLSIPILLWKFVKKTGAKVTLEIFAGY